MEPVDHTTVAIGAETHPVAAKSELEVPKQVGRYRVDGVLGSGGMSVVYVAFDDRLGRQVALKVMRPAAGDSANRAETEARLMREAQAIAGLSHPNVVEVFDVGQIDGRVYMAMELVEGRSLRAWLQEEPRTWREKVRRLIEAGRGLQAAHELAIVHRDSKPTNVLVGDDGRVRVLDFGLARSEDREGLSSNASSSSIRPSSEAERALEQAISSESLSGSLPPLTRAGTIMGTPAYMAPEQVRGETLDARCDQFSFCVTLHECLYGNSPFEGAKPRTRWKNARLGRVRSAPASTSVPRRVRRVVLRGLAPEPEARWSDMRSLLGALEAAIEPRRVWPWVVAATASTVVVAGVATSGDDPCDHPAEALDPVWNLQARDEMRAAFVATAVPGADEVWLRAEQAFDSYAERWFAARQNACADTSLSLEARDAQLACLQQGRAQLEAIVDVFGTADEGVVRRSAETLAVLRPVTDCDSPELLEAEPGPPPKKVAQRVARVREQLSSLGVLRDAQRYDRALEVGAAAIVEADAIGFEPLRAEALSEQGHTRQSRGELEDGAKLFEQAFYLAESSGHDRLSAEIATSLFFVYGYRLSETREAERWRGQAEAAVARIAHVAPKLRAELIRTEGAVALRGADYPRARERFEVAIALYDELGLTESLRFAEVVSDLGATQVQLGELDQASENMQYSRTITEALVGEAHPRVSAIVNNLGTLEQTRGRHELAYQYFLRSYEIDVALFGKEHITVAMGLNNVGTALLILNRSDEATEYFHNSISVYESGDHHGLDLARPVGNLGVVYTRTKDYERAIEYLLRAISLIESVEGPLHADLSGNWLNLGSAYLELGRHEAALEAMGRALAVDTAALGAEHPFVGQTLASMGAVHLDLDQVDLAKPLLERALTVQSAGEVDPLNLASTRFDLARALWPDPDQHARAVELVALAQTALAAAGVPGEERLKAVLTWKRTVHLR